jgi:molybdopterin synthase sulfur carrier subunit
MTEVGKEWSGAAVRVALPFHLRALAKIEVPEVMLEIAAPVTVRRVLDALESRYPMLAGTIREHGTGKRRAFMRVFACEEDWSHEPMDAELPEAVAAGKEPLLILGAIAGGKDSGQ